MPDLISLRSSIAHLFPDFGPNKIREVQRLIFEIAKRENLPYKTILDSIPPTNQFQVVKNILVRRRYPEVSGHGVSIEGAFPALNVDSANAADILNPPLISPKMVYIEQTAASYPLAQRFRNLFSKSRFEVIDSYKSTSQTSDFLVTDYNHRLEVFFLVKEKYDFFKICPCSNGSISCGYHNANLGFGCPFECSYCFLQNYTNSPGIVFPVNLDDFFSVFESYHRSIRVGSGETTDSLAFDHITEFSIPIVDYFRNKPETIFEFKTKSDNIANLLSVKASSNVVIGWSINPQKIIDREEFFTASLESRLKAARQCAEAGYSIAFHFDPIFYYPRWENDYASVVSMVFDNLPNNSIAWISLGTLRMTVRQKKMIENRFPANTILDAELLMSPDGKFRYHEVVRRNIYKTMIGFLAKRLTRRTFVYLCMEPMFMIKDVGLEASRNVCFHKEIIWQK